MKRDLVGYGRRRPAIVWPNGARVAVSLVVNYEEGAELSVEQGDPRGERIGEVLSVVPDGVRDIGMEQIFNYGLRAGLWRFVDAFERWKQRATFYMCGLAIERTPDLACEVVSRGHEAACHGWRWTPHAEFADAASERASLERCIAVAREATGQSPVGFFCRGSPSPYTRQLLADLGFLYDSNAFDDDLPYYDYDVRPRPLLVLPYALDSNDMKFFHPNGFVEPEQMSRYVASALAQLLEEAGRGASAVLNIGFHLRICGRPARFRAVEKILSHLQALDGKVWVATRAEIARHWLEVAPPGDRPA